MRNLWILFAVVLLLPPAVCHAKTPLDQVADRNALPEDRSAAIETCREKGSTGDVVKLLDTRLRDPEETAVERARCIELSGELGKDARPLVPALLDILKDPGPGMGLALRTADALARIAPEDPKVFEAVRAKSVEAGGGMEALAARWAGPLVRFGEIAKPSILVWYRSKSGPTRYMAVRAMESAGAWARPYLLKALKDPEHHVAAAAIDSLIRSGAPAADLMPVLVEGLESSDRRTVISSIDTLGRLGKDAARAVPKIRSFEPGADPYADTVVAHSLFRITGDVDDAAVGRVTAALGAGNFPVQSRAARALSDFGPRAVGAIPELSRQMRRTPIGVRTDLCNALGAIGSKKGIPALVGRLRGDYDDDADNYDDVIRFDDISAAIRALVALDARETVENIEKVAKWESDPDSFEMRRLRRQAREAADRLSR